MGGYPIPGRGVPHPWAGGRYPILGYAHPDLGVPHLGIPHPDLVGEYPIPGGRYPVLWYPPSGTGVHPGRDLGPVTGVPPEGHGTSGSIMGCRWGTPRCGLINKLKLLPSLILRTQAVITILWRAWQKVASWNVVMHHFFVMHLQPALNMLCNAIWSLTVVYISVQYSIP